MMTVKEVQDILQEIRDCADDDESAHIMQSNLFSNIIQEISQSESEWADVCGEAYKAWDIQFQRWFA